MKQGSGAMEQPQVSTREKRVYFVMNNTSGAWVKISDEYSRVSDAVKALEQLLSTYPFARLGGATVG